MNFLKILRAIEIHNIGRGRKMILNKRSDSDLCKQLIDVASVAGCDFVKIQKRTPICALQKIKKII